jgi:hypothetical protein
MEGGAILGLHGLEAIRDAVNGWHIGVTELRQAGHTSVAASRAAQLFVPLIGHWRGLVCIWYRNSVSGRAADREPNDLLAYVGNRRDANHIG